MGMGRLTLLTLLGTGLSLPVLAQETVVPEPVSAAVTNYTLDRLAQQPPSQVCQGNADWTYARQHSEVFRLPGSDRQFVILRCFLASYQTAVQLFELDQTQIRPWKLMTYWEPGVITGSAQPSFRETDQFGALVTYRPDQNQLTVWSRCRGLGDCGTYATYRFQDGQFRLTLLRARFLADESVREAARFADWQTWPKIYPSDRSQTP